MENRLPGEIQPLAPKDGFYLGKLDGDFLAARGSFFQLLGDLQIGQRFVPSMQPDQGIRQSKRDLGLLSGRYLCRRVACY